MQPAGFTSLPIVRGALRCVRSRFKWTNRGKLAWRLWWLRSSVEITGRRYEATRVRKHTGQEHAIVIVVRGGVARSQSLPTRVPHVWDCAMSPLPRVRELVAGEQLFLPLHSNCSQSCRLPSPLRLASFLCGLLGLLLLDLLARFCVSSHCNTGARRSATLICPPLVAASRLPIARERVSVLGETGARELGDEFAYPRIGDALLLQQIHRQPPHPRHKVRSTRRFMTRRPSSRGGKR